MSNVTSNVSLSTRFNVWLRTIPVITKAVLFVCVGLYLIGFVFGTFNGTVCYSSSSILNRKQVYRLVSGAWFHNGILHIALNMMAFLPMGSELERHMGSIQFMFTMLLFDIACGVIHLIISSVAFYNPFFSYDNWMFECAVGLSGVIFALLTVSTNNSQSSTRSVFGIVQVSASLYPWVLLIILQLIMPGISFLGHLSGIIAGYLYSYGYLNKVMFSDSSIRSMETSRSLGWLISMDGFISCPGSNPYTSVVPPNLGLPNTRIPSLPVWTHPQMQSSFAGPGRTLGTANEQSKPQPTMAEVSNKAEDSQ